MGGAAGCWVRPTAVPPAEVYGRHGHRVRHVGNSLWGAPPLLDGGGSRGQRTAAAHPRGAHYGRDRPPRVVPQRAPAGGAWAGGPRYAQRRVSGRALPRFPATCRPVAMLGGDDDGGGGGGNGGGGYTGSGSEGATGMGAAPADVKSHTPPPPPLSLRSGDDGTKAAAIGNGMDDASPTGVQQQATATASVIAAAALPVSVPPAPALPGGIIPLPPTAGAVEDGAHAGGEGKVRAASPVATARCAAVPVVGNRGVGSLEATPLAAVAIPTEPPPHGPGTKAVRSAGAAGAPLAAGAAIASPMGRPSDGGGAVCAAVTTAATATSPAVAAALYKSRGNAHFAAGAYDKAVAAYTAGLEAEPRNVNLLSNRYVPSGGV